MQREAERTDEWQDDSLSEGDADDGSDVPHTFKSRKEERIYLGRGYNRLGLKKDKLPETQVEVASQAMQ